MELPEKTCRKCGVVKPVNDFYQDKSRSDGRRNSCIECDKARKRTDEVRAQSRRYYHSEKGKTAERRYVESGKKAAVSAEYRKRPEVIAKRRAIQPEYARRYYYGPKGQERQQRLKQDPQHNTRRRERVRKWLSRPEVRERVNAQARVLVQRRMHRKRQLPATFTNQDWERCQKYFGYCCVYCGTSGPLTQDHFIPLASGGAYIPENIVPACRSCNTSKHDDDPKKWCAPEAYERVTAYFRTLQSV